MHSRTAVIAVPANPRPRQLQSTAIVVDARDLLTNRSRERRSTTVMAKRIRVPDLGPARVVDEVRVDVHRATYAVEHRARIVESDAGDSAVPGRGVAGAAGPTDLITRGCDFVAHVDGTADDVRHRRIVEAAGAIDLEVRIEEDQGAAVLGPNRVRRLPALMQGVEIGGLAGRNQNVAIDAEAVGNDADAAAVW